MPGIVHYSDDPIPVYPNGDYARKGETIRVEYPNGVAEIFEVQSISSDGWDTRIECKRKAIEYDATRMEPKQFTALCEVTTPEERGDTRNTSGD